MSQPSNIAFRSCLKTTVASLALLLLALPTALVALLWLPKPVDCFVAAFAVFVALGVALVALAGATVLVRIRRSLRGEPDLFLELNHSREPDVIAFAATARFSRARRWLARQLLGHDLLVGDVVEVKLWEEICATLDERGCLEQLPFMPEMRAMCGQRAYVFRCMHRLFDYHKSRRMRHMSGAVLLLGAVCDGASHGGCEAACHTIWKSAWLRRVELKWSPSTMPMPGLRPDVAAATNRLQFGTDGPHYACQLTQLNAASRATSDWNVANLLRPLVSGNVTPAAFIVAWLTNLFNEVQQKRRGIGFPAFEPAARGVRIGGEIRLRAGDKVVVRTSAEIKATLNDQLIHRGLGFEVDMLKHCGRRCCVQGEIRRLIDIVTGEMRTMKTPAYILRGVHFSGERQLFNAQYEPLFWRGVWLQRAED